MLQNDQDIGFESVAKKPLASSFKYTHALIWILELIFFFYVLFHRTNFPGLFSIVAITATFGLPALGILLLRKHFILKRATDKPEKLEKTDWNAENFPAYLTFPALMPGAAIASLLYQLIWSGSPQNLKAFIQRRSYALPLSLLAPSTVLSFLFVSRGWGWSGAYVALACAYTSMRLATMGMRVEKGVLMLFAKDFVGIASPAFILTCAVIFATAFGAIHFAIWSFDNLAYVKLSDWQDALYFSFTTAATVGYGDITPATHLAKWACVVEIICGFVLLVVAVKASMTVWIQNHQPSQANAKEDVADSARSKDQ